MRFWFLIAALAGGSANAAYDVDDVALGASERDVKSRFPQANCRALEWRSRAADRRCDDSRIKFAGTDASATFYLKRDAVEGVDVRFDRRQLEHVAKLLRERYGKPAAETTAPPVRIEWKSGAERAVLRSEPANRRASLLVWRGSFYEELYKIR